MNAHRTISTIIMIAVTILLGGCDGNGKSEDKSKSSVTKPQEEKKEQSTPAPTAKPTHTGSNPNKVWIVEAKVTRYSYYESTGEWAWTDFEFHCHEKGNFAEKVHFYQREEGDWINAMNGYRIRKGAELDWRKLKPEQVVSKKSITHNGLKLWRWEIQIQFDLHNATTTREGVQSNNAQAPVVNTIKLSEEQVNKLIKSNNKQPPAHKDGWPEPAPKSEDGK